MRKNTLLLLAIFIGSLVSCDSTDPKPEDKIDIPEGYQLVWSDEFDASEINADLWTYETGDGTDFGLPVGWGNDEKQIYTISTENSSIATDQDESVLKITALSDGSGGYTSAKLKTKNLDMRFGKIDVKAKLAEGQGIWSAIWMLGNNRDLIDWPGCGEIDIVELLGHEPAKAYSTIHFTNGENGKDEIQTSYESTSTFSESYHVFGLEWSPESLIFSLDGIQTGAMPIEDDMKEFLRGFYLIMNVAVGGYWPGDPDNTTVLPQSMFVDYVRVYEKIDFTAPAAPALNVEEETIGQIIEQSIADNAIRTDFTALGNLKVIAYGGGGEPVISSSETAIEGDLSLVFDFPGGKWGGAYIELEAPKNISNFTHFNFSLNKPAAFVDAEIKLESKSTNATVFLKNYTGTSAANDFTTYSIPLSDFTGLNTAELTIPFSIWNPLDANKGFVTATLLIDDIYFSN
ncbi:MAG: beta-glucanase (GH16 family) [Marinoscillum sp.]|jgi:beta-glucanase (GH16 family)